ncbi:RGS1-HXK1-interacting protein 1 [Magnolia sinica]|uniref:RGS1-HXK1-interacting protein 1 n=1 Tax=Magnolia sinica TaxID=86752 RepID=UPI00265A0E32|nr:RGS1-HXK1-interacting protein 1 [Magnolia sinica]
MTTVAADPEEKSSYPRVENSSQALEEKPWIEYAIQQYQILKATLEETADSALQTARSRLSQIHSTSSAHLHQTLESLETIKDEFAAYENLFVGKIKEGLIIAGLHPAITCGVAGGLGIIILKRPRRFLFHSTQRLFMSEESLISKADAKVKELRKAIDNMKFESKVLEERASRAEEEMERGKTKLRQAGRQIQGVINSSYKIERQASGLKDVLGELPSREASRFRSQVSSLASVTKQERKALAKEVSKITNYGISI